MYSDKVSFQRVLAPLLHLVTMPRFSSSTLTQLVIPVLSTIYTELPLRKVRDCVRRMVEMRAFQEPSFLTAVRSRAVPQNLIIACCPWYTTDPEGRTKFAWPQSKKLVSGQCKRLE